MEVVPMQPVTGPEAALDIVPTGCSQEVDPSSSSDVQSVLGSQASSFGESTSSQLVQQQTKAPSQAPALDTLAEKSSGLNSTGGHSDSEKEIPHVYAPASVNGGPTVPRIDTNLSTDQHTRINGIQNELKQGQKRTASGHVKTPSSSTITSPLSALNVAAPAKGHKRQSSSMSQVGELSAQLRARLSYAMVKVNHGWETRKIDEVEALASQQPSPLSSTASPHRQLKTPDSAREFPAFSHLEPRTLAPSRPLTATDGPRYDMQFNLQESAPPSSSAPQQYSHKHGDHKGTGPSLAPPVDFARHPKRINKPIHPYPSLQATSRQGSNLSRSPGSPGSRHPIQTPPQNGVTSSPRNQTPRIQTAQDDAEKERDAIETLLFMSSPNNSQGTGSYGGANGHGGHRPGHLNGLGINGTNGTNGHSGHLGPQNYHVPPGSFVNGHSHLGPGPFQASPLPQAQSTNPTNGYQPNGYPTKSYQPNGHHSNGHPPRPKEVWERASGNMRDEESIDRVLDQMQGVADDSSDDERV